MACCSTYPALEEEEPHSSWLKPIGSRILVGWWRRLEPGPGEAKVNERVARVSHASQEKAEGTRCRYSAKMADTPAADRVGMVRFEGTVALVGAACIVNSRIVRLGIVGPGIAGIVNHGTENLGIVGPRIVDLSCGPQLGTLRNVRRTPVGGAAHGMNLAAALHNRLGVEAVEEGEVVVVVNLANTVLLLRLRNQFESS